MTCDKNLNPIQIMKTNSIKLLVVALLSSLILHPLSLLGQGALTPSGAPAATMRTLLQVEPRTPISSLPYTITNSGSYYLTTNLTGVSSDNGIVISSGNVTLDLNGFTMQGVSGSSRGIVTSGTHSNITVRNGMITGWDGDGVDASTCVYQVFEHLTVSANGDNGISCSGGLVSSCVACDNTSSGIIIYNGTVSGCYVGNNDLCGIDVNGNGSRVIGNNCFSNSSYGICVIASNNRIEDNHVTGSAYGINIFSGHTNNIIVKNTVIGNIANNYTIPTNQIVGPIITNTVSGTITNSNPWANFSF